MERVAVNSIVPVLPQSTRGVGLEVQVEEQMNASDFNAVGTHDDCGIGSRGPTMDRASRSIGAARVAAAR